ncbi:MAG: ATP-dependent RecD-like DNA helicase, partial [Desulfuromonadaceae bacterium]|nr:ATP-dependent RecD-like DNA helicase [Desulfuromonadaceae bacterium]
VEELLGAQVPIEDALATCQDRIVEWEGRDLVQLKWAFVVEQHVQKEILERTKMLERWPALLAVEFDENRLNKFEETVGYPLSPEQLKAVRTVFESPVSCIFGGIGVGKFHVLNAIFDQIGDRATIFLLASTGPATNSRHEIIGIKPISIVKFQKKLDEGGIAENAWLFIDEASVLDVAVAYRILKKLPRTVRICFIGDSYRLFPKGPGLVFHAMESAKRIPQVELVTTHRSELETGIPQVANAVRSLTIPEIENFVGLRKRKVGVSFLESTCVETTVQNILRVYRESKEYGDVQIVAATKDICGLLNQALHKEHRELREYQRLEIPVLNLQNCNALTGNEEITVGDPVVWHSMNDHSRGLCDGMLGTVTEIFEGQMWDITDAGLEVRYVAEIDFRGSLVKVHEGDLAYISLGYAIACNEIQGSQFERVIVAVTETGDNRIVDNPWLYTAITSAQKQVVLVGDKGVFTREVTSQPRAFDRVIGLNFN